MRYPTSVSSMRQRPLRLGAPALLLAVLCAIAVIGAAPAGAQTGTITGQVVDEGTGRPIPSARVVIVGTDQGTLTDTRGSFLIPNVRAGTHEVRATSIGFRAGTLTVVVQANAAARADFRLGASAIALDEIVVTGQVGETERRAIGNTIAQISAQEVMELAPVGSMQALINARAPGVVIMPGTGMVGSGSKIRIRGASSLSISNEPLIYVDGIRVDNAQATGPLVQAFGSAVINRLNDFNPDDIESIEIIKGPAAATLYGTEASNGVIQIITRRGRVGPPVFSATVRQGANWFANAEGRVPVNHWVNPATNELHSLNFLQSERELGNNVFRTGRVENYSLGISGGMEGIRYYVAGDFDREEGAEIDNVLRRSSGRVNVVINPRDAWEIAGNLGFVRGRTDLSCEGGCGGTTWATYYSTPFHRGTNDPNRVRLEDGTDRRRGARSLTPEAYYGIYDRFQDLSRFTGSVTVLNRPASWFSHRLVFGQDEAREDNQTIFERTALYQEWFPTGTGGKDVDRRDAATTSFDYSGTIRALPLEGLTSNTSFGTQFYRRETRLVGATGRDFALPGLRVISASADRLSTEVFVNSTTVGVFGEQQFGWQNRLFLTFGLRADDHSAFGEEFSLVWYPRTHATWVISEEPFWQVPALNTLRLRTAYGMTGLAPGPFDARRTYIAVPGPGDVATVTPSNVGNPLLGPERSAELELGFDLGVFGERVGLEYTHYRSRTRDGILLQAVAPSSGFPGARFVNIGELANWGHELMIRGQAVSRRNFGLNLTFSVAQNDSEILDLGGPETIVESAFGVQHRLGQPVGAWYHRRIVSADFNAQGRVITASMMCDDGAGGTTACYSGNTPVAPHVFLGRSLPRREGAFSATATLAQRVQIYGLMDFKTGHLKWDAVTRVRCSLNHTCLESRDVRPLDYVDSHPELVAAYQTGDAFGAHYLNDASFAKLREVSARYFLPSNVAQRLRTQTASVSIAGRNLYTWTKWTGMEPEAMFLGGARGGFVQFEQNHLPQLTQFVASFNFTF
jgi:TonB-linked SusC/RagA family outer membrane protein